MFGVMCTPEPVQLVGLWGVLAAWATNKQESSQELPSELTHHSSRFGHPLTVCLASSRDHHLSSWTGRLALFLALRLVLC